MEKQADVPVPAQNKAQTLPPDVLAVAVFQPRRAAFSRRAIVLYAIWAILIVLIGAEAGYLVSSLADDVYGARTEIEYQLDQNLSSGFLREDRALTTQLVKIKSREVLAPVAQANNLSVDDLRDKVKAAVVDSSEVLGVEVDDKSRDRAQRLVGAIATEYLKVARPDIAAAEQTEVEKQLADVGAQEADLNTQLANAEEPQLTRIQNRLRALDDQRTDLQSQLNEIRRERINQPVVRQLTKPYLLKDPVSPKPLKTAIAGGLAGFALVTAAATFLIRRHLAEQRD
jgi:uncharacterized protein involved in exopolysaccharide biosynthesis